MRFAAERRGPEEPAQRFVGRTAACSLANLEIAAGQRDRRGCVKLFTVMKEPDDLLSVAFLQLILDLSESTLPFWKRNRLPLPIPTIAFNLHLPVSLSAPPTATAKSRTRLFTVLLFNNLLTPENQSPRSTVASLSESE